MLGDHVLCMYDIKRPSAPPENPYEFWQSTLCTYTFVRPISYVLGPNDIYIYKKI